MLEHAVWPVSLKEPPSRVDGIMRLLTHFSTKRVNVLHVTEEERHPRPQTRTQLEQLKERLEDTGIRADIGFRHGHVASAVCDFALEQHADLIALPWKTKMILARALVGDVVRDVIRLANCPVAVYRPPAGGQRDETVDRIMYATAFSETDRVVMSYLRHPGLKADTLYLLTVGSRAPDPQAEKRRQQKVEESLDKLAAECTECYRRVEKIADMGRPEKRIIGQARSNEVDLIVAGKYDKPGPFKLPMGSIVERLPHRAPCSLLIIPPESPTATGGTGTSDKA